MANLASDVQFNGFNLDLNLLIRAQYNYNFFDSINYTYNGKKYNDIAEFIYLINNDYYAAIFGGSDLSVNSSNNVSGGTVTGFLNLYWTGSKWVESWGIESISYSASALAAAAKTTTTSDDYKIIKAIMKGNDNITMSKYADTVSGYSGNDVIKGMGGDDILYGDTGSDKLDGGSGNDIIHGDVSYNDSTY
jgi:Ca2+-binding RTX toxin-like protein